MIGATAGIEVLSLSDSEAELDELDELEVTDDPDASALPFAVPAPRPLASSKVVEST